MIGWAQACRVVAIIDDRHLTIGKRDVHERLQDMPRGVPTRRTEHGRPKQCKPNHYNDHNRIERNEPLKAPPQKGSRRLAGILRRVH